VPSPVAIALKFQTIAELECGAHISANVSVSDHIARAMMVCRVQVQAHHAPTITIEMFSEIALMIAHGSNMVMLV
jgi:hypothetical protein